MCQKKSGSRGIFCAGLGLKYAFVTFVTGHGMNEQRDKTGN
jgi:hypothetical protein